MWFGVELRTRTAKCSPGETHLQIEPPIDPSSLTRWRQRLGEEGIEEQLAVTIYAA